MRKVFFFLSLFSFLTLAPAFSEEVSPAEKNGVLDNLDQSIEEKFGPISTAIQEVVFYAIPVATDADGNAVKMPWVLGWLGIAAIVFTVYFKFINFRSWKLAFETVRGKYSSSTDPGEITHFQALTAALSGTVGLGNIAGVAVAVGIGGPGATFWMILMGLFGMASKFCECTLGVKYRQIENGKVYGGPMQYLTRGLGEMGLGSLGMILAFLFAILCIGGSFGGGNMYQANQACSQLIEVTGGEGSFFDNNRWVFGIMLGVAVGL
ncbi:alanine:cation symporter family protein, partial [Akkermansiaceae bacterium]|nr:alanine:cation symporter family protein [Akkermansiaceae bacterium]